MASTITALTGGGGVAVAGDTSGVLELKTNNGTTAMTIDTSQNVGIGTGSPSSFDATGRSLVVGSGSASQGISINSGTTGTGNLLFAKGTTGSDPYRGVVRYDHASDFMAYWTAGVERMRITSAGGISFGSSGTAFGTSTQVLQSNGDAAPTWVAGPIGNGQTWTDVSASRAIGTTYTNTTGRPIMVCPTVASTSASGGALRFLINGVNICNQGAVQNASIATLPSVSMIVPAGATYSIANVVSGSANILLTSWYELR